MGKITISDRFFAVMAGIALCLAGFTAAISSVLPPNGWLNHDDGPPDKFRMSPSMVEEIVTTKARLIELVFLTIALCFAGAWWRWHFGTDEDSWD